MKSDNAILHRDVTMRELIVERRAGGTALFDQVAKALLVDIERLMRSANFHDDDAGEIATQSLLRLHRQLSRGFRHDSYRVSHYLFTICLPHARNDLLRRKQRSSERGVESLSNQDEDTGQTLEDEIPDYRSPERIVLAKAARKILRCCLKELPERIFSTFRLRCIYALTYEEVAQVLGLSGPARVCERFNTWGPKLQKCLTQNGYFD